MNDREFRKHLADLTHGKHHPEEHDWTAGDKPQAEDKPAPKKARKPAVKTKQKRTR
jgi:hypothetical protein